jgi:hypothetical protein
VDLYLHSPRTPLWRGAQLKHRDNFTFTFTFCFFYQTALINSSLNIPQSFICIAVKLHMNINSDPLIDI